MSDYGETDFGYSNLSGRRNGPIVTLASKLSRGVREVQAQVEPYAHAWELHNRRALSTAGPLWVVLGDSMAQGVGATAYDRGWAGQLGETLPEHRLVNLSVYGGRVADVIDRQIPAMETLGVEPDLVTVIIGSNDLISRRLRSALPESLATMLERLPTGTVVGNQPGRRADALVFNQMIEHAVSDRELVLADFRDPRMRSWRGKLSPDHFHPNDLGYAGMARIMAEAIARRLHCFMLNHVKLGASGLDVSPLILGCMSYGVPDRGTHTWSLDADLARPFIQQALEAGITTFDTANVYSAGTSEEIVGRALADFARREDVVIATKVHGRMRPGPNGAGLSRAAIMTEIDGSLRRLGTDYVDLYQI
ncbi:MAG: hydrolase family protein, partial [Nocardioidaceae bacterium]|nr:hydrolase family protein [Nocardioidaceae bacterium]